MVFLPFVKKPKRLNFRRFYGMRGFVLPIVVLTTVTLSEACRHGGETYSNGEEWVRCMQSERVSHIATRVRTRPSDTFFVTL